MNRRVGMSAVCLGRVKSSGRGANVTKTREVEQNTKSQERLFKSDEG